MPKKVDRSRVRCEQTNDFAQQRRLAATGTANQAKHLPGSDIKVDLTMNHRLAKTRTQTANLDHGHV